MTRHKSASNEKEKLAYNKEVIFKEWSLKTYTLYSINEFYQNHNDCFVMSEQVEGYS